MALSANEETQTKRIAPIMAMGAFTGEIDPQKSIRKSDIYIPTWDNRPLDLPPLITLNGVSILSHQNITSIIAAPGMGKSSICEAILASHINKKADCLGISVSEECAGLIYVDFERTNLDVWNSFYRMNRRAGVQQGDPITGVTIVGMRSIPRLKERLDTLDDLLIENPCSLLILDGAGDMVVDTNDLPQAIECRILLREFTVKYNLSILTTLHPNPGSFKPRGHIGSEILRESECVLVAKKGEGESRILTSDFEHGKNRNNAPITAGYTWSEHSSMFVSSEVDNSTSRSDFKALQKRSQVEMIIREVLPPLTSITHTDLINKICHNSSCSVSTAKRHKNNAVAWEIIEQDSAGNYRLMTAGSEFNVGSN